MENRLLVANYNNTIFIKPLGHITANITLPIREHLLKKISSFSCCLSISIDLSNTDYMDSTFMGLLVGLDKELFKKFKIHLEILNPNDISIKLMKNMGLDKYLKIFNKNLPENIEFSIFDENYVVSEIDKSKIILDAHKNLSSLNEENEKKFKFLQDVLEKQINEKENN